MPIVSKPSTDEYRDNWEKIYGKKKKKKKKKDKK